MKNSQVIPLKIELTDIITPKSCASFVAELIKFIVYNKQQIPFPYERLKMFVLKRREHQQIVIFPNTNKQTNPSVRIAFLMEKYYKKVEEAFEILESTFKCIEHELTGSSEYPVEEIVLLFGATPLSPKDIYRIQIPSLSQGHSEKEHMWKKQMANLFRSIVVSDELHNNMQRNASLTNMFVMMKVKEGRKANSKWLLPKDHYRLSERAQQVCFSFVSTSSKPCSCPPEPIHLEAITQRMAALNANVNECELKDTVHFGENPIQSLWFQTQKTLKGFKDCKSDGKSVTDLWYLHNFI